MHDQTRFADALNFACKWHGASLRKSARPVPYLSHPIQVMSRLAHHGLQDSTLLQAALLHDVLEDTSCGADRMRDAFGVEVTAIVLEVTDDKSLHKKLRKQHQVERAPYLSRNARLIRLADKIDNVAGLFVTPPAGWSPHRVRNYIA